MIDDCRAYDGASQHICHRRSGQAALLQIDDDRLIGLIGPAGLEREANDIEAYGSAKFEDLGTGERVCKVAGVIAGRLDGGAQSVGSMDLEREPGFQRAKSARQIRTEIAGPDVTSGKAPRSALEIGSGARECSAMHFAVAHQKEPGIVGDMRPFVKVEGNRIGEFNAREPGL